MAFTACYVLPLKIMFTSLQNVEYDGPRADLILHATNFYEVKILVVDYRYFSY